MPSFSLKIKMILVVFLMIAAVSTGVAGLGLLFFIREFKSDMASRQFAMVSAVAGELDDKIVAAQRALVAVARSVPPSLTRDPQGMQRFLDGRLDLHQVFGDGTGFFSTQGRLLASAPGQDTLIGADFSGHDFFRRTIDFKKPLISEPLVSAKGDGRKVVVFTVPVFDGRGHLSGVLGGRVDLLEQNFLERLAWLKVGESGNFFLFNNRRQMIVHKNPESLPQNPLARGQSELLDLAVAGYEGSGEAPSPAGSPALCSFKRLQSPGWILATHLPLAEAYAAIDQARRLTGYSLALLLPLALAGVWIFVGHFTEPLLLFARRVREMGASGAGGMEIPVSTSDEIGVLAQAFNSMMQELGRQRQLLENEKGFAEQLLQQSAVPCYVLDAEHRVIIWNRACEELTGIPASELLGGKEPWRAFYHEPRRVLADVVLDGALYEMADLYSCYADSPLIPEGLRAEGWFKLKGKQRFLCFDAAPIRNADDQVIAAIETLQDVTLRANTEEQLRGALGAIKESEERFRRLVELSLDGIAILVKRRFVFTNPAGCEMLGFQVPEEALGRRMRDFIQRESEELFDEQVDHAEKSSCSAPWFEQRLLRKDGTALEVELGVSRFVYRGEEALQVIFRDITERKLAKARLESLAHYDSLTSLPNRVLFFDRLNHAVTEAKRYQHALALMYLDLDRFKQVNDTLGHAAGDAVLVEAGHRLKECVRGCDMVARMGGDEFTVILSKLAEEGDAALVAERIIAAFQLPFAVDGALASVGVSIGICVYPSYELDLDGMVRRADLALYRVKEEGRNGYLFYSEELKLRAAG